MKKILGGFVHEKGVHSDTTALRDMFASAGHRFPEQFFFGIGEGLGFYYWNGRNLTRPMIGGRIGNLELDRRACHTLGVPLSIHTSTSTRRAQENMLSQLEKGRPVMVHADQYYLKFTGKDKHFGSHCVVIAGVDEDGGVAYVADRSLDGLVEVPLSELSEARASRHRPFPPQNRWFEMSIPPEITADARSIMGAIGRNAIEMLNSGIRNVGVGGIYYFANCLYAWKDAYTRKELGAICREAHDAIEGDGTGGGCFRYMYADFLRYAGERTGVEALSEVSDGYRRAGAVWSQAAKMLLEVECGCTSLSEVSDLVTAIATKEHELQVSLMTAANLCCRRK